MSTHINDQVNSNAYLNTEHSGCLSHRFLLRLPHESYIKLAVNPGPLMVVRRLRADQMTVSVPSVVRLPRLADEKLQQEFVQCG